MPDEIENKMNLDLRAKKAIDLEPLRTARSKVNRIEDDSVELLTFNEYISNAKMAKRQKS